MSTVNPSFVQERVTKTHALIELINQVGPRLDEHARSSFWVNLMPGSSAPISTILNAHVEQLQQASEELDQATQQTQHEKADDLDLRGQIGEAIILLRQTIDRTRDRIIEIDNVDTLQIYNMASPPPRARQALIDYTKTAIDLMRAHPYTFQDVLGDSIDTKRVAKFLAQTLAPLEELALQMDGEMEELRQAIEQRNEAHQQWLSCFHGTAKILEGFLRFAGLEEDAESVRHLV